MKKLALLVAGLALSTQASATISWCIGPGAGCDPVGGGDLENVLFTSFQIGSDVEGFTTTSSLGVTFSSTTDVLETVAVGQAALESNSDSYINDLSVQMTNTVFGMEVVRFTVDTDTDGTIDLGYTDQLDNFVQNAYAVSAAGENWFTILATDPDQLKSINIQGSNIIGVTDFKHFRIDADILPPTPNPGSEVPIPAAAWLFGSGLLGLVAIGRKRKATL